MPSTLAIWTYSDQMVEQTESDRRGLGLKSERQ